MYLLQIKLGGKFFENLGPEQRLVNPVTKGLCRAVHGAHRRPELEDAARGDENLIPIMVEAVEHYATLGEICARLRTVWGEQREHIGV